MEWVKFDGGWIKINFGRASKENLGPLGAGCVVRDLTYNILESKSKKLEDGTNKKEESQAALLAVEIKKLNLSRTVEPQRKFTANSKCHRQWKVTCLENYQNHFNYLEETFNFLQL